LEPRQLSQSEEEEQFGGVASEEEEGGVGIVKARGVKVHPILVLG